MATSLTPDPIGALSADSVVTRRAAIDALVARCAPPRGRMLRDRIRACLAYAIGEGRLTVHAGDMVRLGEAARALLENRKVGDYKADLGDISDAPRGASARTFGSLSGRADSFPPDRADLVALLLKYRDAVEVLTAAAERRASTAEAKALAIAARRMLDDPMSPGPSLVDLKNALAAPLLKRKRRRGEACE